MGRKHNSNAMKTKKLCISRITDHSQVNNGGMRELRGQYLEYIIGPGFVLRLLTLRS